VVGSRCGSAVVRCVGNSQKEERSLSGEHQVGGSLPGVPIASTAERSGSRDGAARMQ